MLRPLFAWSLGAAALLGAGPATETAWEAYTNKPTPENARLVSKMSYSRALDEARTLEAIENDLGVLEAEVIAGDREAVRLAFRLLPTTDGHGGEILAEILGRLIRIQPKMFLEELKRHRHLVARLDSLVGDLGYAFVDRDEAHHYELAARAAALGRVSESGLRRVRDECIAELAK